MTGVYIAARVLLRGLEELFDFDDTPAIDPARMEAECQRQEWNRHPVDRLEPEAGMGSHIPSDLRH